MYAAVWLAMAAVIAATFLLIYCTLPETLGGPSRQQPTHDWTTQGTDGYPRVLTDALKVLRLLLEDFVLLARRFSV